MKLLLELDPQSKREVEEACNRMTCAQNALVRKEGFSPCQHVLGHDVRISGSLLHAEPCEQVESRLIMVKRCMKELTACAWLHEKHSLRLKVKKESNESLATEQGYNVDLSRLARKY